MKIKIDFQKIFLYGFLYGAASVSSLLISNSALASPTKTSKNMGQASIAYTATAETSTSTMSHAQELQHKISDFNVALARAFHSRSSSIQQLPKRALTFEECERCQNFKKRDLLRRLKSNCDLFRSEYLEKSDELLMLTVRQNQITGELLNLSDKYMLEKKGRNGQFVAVRNLYNSFDTLILTYLHKFSEVDETLKKLSTNFEHVSRLTASIVEGVSSEPIARRKKTIEIIKSLEDQNRELAVLAYSEFCNCRYSLHEISTAMTSLTDARPHSR